MKYHGCSISSVVLAKEQVNIKVSPFFIKVIGRKIVIGTDLWLKNKPLIYKYYKRYEIIPSQATIVKCTMYN